MPNGLIPAGLAAILAAGVAADAGGLQADTRAWLALFTLAGVTVLLLARPSIELGALDFFFVGGLLLLTAWAAVSTASSPSTTITLDDVARLLAYAGTAALLVLVTRRRTVPHLLAGALAGVTAVTGYALLTRLLPGRLTHYDGLGLYRLSEPIGYWNGLGAYAAIGTVLALGLAARGSHRLARGLAAAAPVILLPTLYFTFSRGAWLALAAGLLGTTAAGPRRLQYLWTLVVLAPWPVLAVLAASRAEALTNRGAPLEDAAAAGHRYMLVVAVLATVAGLLGAALAQAERSFELERSVRVVFAVSLAAVAAAAVLVAWGRFGAPWTIAADGWDRFWSQPADSSGRGDSDDLGASVFTLASNGRAELWRTAWDGFRSAPVTGHGAGSFAHTWYLHRRAGLTSANDAHNLYVETLSELGVVGLGLLVLGLGAPLVAAFRARAVPFVGAAVGAYAVFLVAAAVDWQWEVPGVAVVALVAATGLVALARDAANERRVVGWVRAPAGAVAAALTAVALVALLGSLPLARARDGGTDLAGVIRDAHRASRLAPWSSAPWLVLGDAQLAHGRRAAARRSYGRAVAREPKEWVLWYRLALVSTGANRAHALAQARRLNPLERSLVDAG